LGGWQISEAHWQGNYGTIGQFTSKHELTKSNFCFNRMLMKKNSYSRSEVLAAGHNLPERGPICHDCKARIPVFEDLSEADEQRIRQCIRDGRHLMAMQELRTATGCSLEWAKLWVQHDGRPKPAKEPTPCPFCGMPLRTSLAKQCRHCRRDWHDEENVVQL